jgi:low temperature requirement protein LtrA
MRGLVVPDVDDDFTVDQVELYFDLAFVYAFSQVVAYLHDEHSLEGIARAGLLFVMLWIPWSQFTWSANAISSSARVVRFLFLIATIATIPAAATVRSAFESGGFVFAGGVATISVMALLAMLASLPDLPDLRASAVRYSGPVFLSMATFIVGGLLDGSSRLVVWVAAALIFLYSTVRAGEGEWIVRSGHFAERHGLIVIVALGEVIVAIGIPVVDQFLEGDDALGGTTLLALVLAGLLGGLLWWSYFDRVAPALEHHSERTKDRQARGRFSRDAYTYCHMFIAGGVILAAAALEEITLHPDEPLEAVWRWMLIIGLSSFLLGIVVAVYRAYRVVAKERLIAVVLLAAVLPFVTELDGVWVLALVDFILAGMVVTEHIRVEGIRLNRRRPATEPVGP